MGDGMTGKGTALILAGLFVAIGTAISWRYYNVVWQETPEGWPTDCTERLLVDLWPANSAENRSGMIVVYNRDDSRLNWAEALPSHATFNGFAGDTPYCLIEHTEDGKEINRGRKP